MAVAKPNAGQLSIFADLYWVGNSTHRFTQLYTIVAQFQFDMAAWKRCNGRDAIRIYKWRYAICMSRRNAPLMAAWKKLKLG